MADWKKLHHIGTINGKEYYLDLFPTIENDKGKVVPNPNFKRVIWRVPDIRESVEAEPGYLILSADYSQIEVKLMAHLSGDPVLIDAINAGGDIHSFNAAAVFGATKHFTYNDVIAAKKDKNHPRYAELIHLRNAIKTVTFGVPYGAGKNKVALMTGMSPDEAQEFIDAFFGKFVQLGKWLKDTGDFAIKYGFSKSPLGRRRFYDLPAPDAKDKEKEKIISQYRRYAGNHPIQAGNVDMLKPAMVLVYNKLRSLPSKSDSYSARGCRMLFCVHDEIVMTAPEELALRRDEQGKTLTLEQVEKCRKAKIKTVKGPVEDILASSMTETYDAVIQGIQNSIDVSISKIWEKA